MLIPKQLLRNNPDPKPKKEGGFLGKVLDVANQFTEAAKKLPTPKRRVETEYGTIEVETKTKWTKSAQKAYKEMLEEQGRREGWKRKDGTVYKEPTLMSAEKQKQLANDFAKSREAQSMPSRPSIIKAPEEDDTNPAFVGKPQQRRAPGVSPEAQSKGDAFFKSLKDPASWVEEYTGGDPSVVLRNAQGQMPTRNEMRGPRSRPSTPVPFAPPSQEELDADKFVDLDTERRTRLDSGWRNLREKLANFIPQAALLNNAEDLTKSLIDWNERQENPDPYLSLLGGAALDTINYPSRVLSGVGNMFDPDATAEERLGAIGNLLLEGLGAYGTIKGVTNAAKTATALNRAGKLVGKDRLTGIQSARAVLEGSQGGNIDDIVRFSRDRMASAGPMKLGDLLLHKGADDLVNKMTESGALKTKGQKAAAKAYWVDRANTWVEENPGFSQKDFYNEVSVAIDEEIPSDALMQSMFAKGAQADNMGVGIWVGPDGRTFRTKRGGGLHPHEHMNRLKNVVWANDSESAVSAAAGGGKPSVIIANKEYNHMNSRSGHGTWFDDLDIMIRQNPKLEGKAEAFVKTLLLGFEKTAKNKNVSKVGPVKFKIGKDADGKIVRGFITPNMTLDEIRHLIGLDFENGAELTKRFMRKDVRKMLIAEGLPDYTWIAEGLAEGRTAGHGGVQGVFLPDGGVIDGSSRLLRDHPSYSKYATGEAGGLAQPGTRAIDVFEPGYQAWLVRETGMYNKYMNARPADQKAFLAGYQKLDDAADKVEYKKQWGMRHTAPAEHHFISSLRKGATFEADPRRIERILQSPRNNLGGRPGQDEVFAPTVNTGRLVQEVQPGFIPSPQSVRGVAGEDVENFVKLFRKSAWEGSPMQKILLQAFDGGYNGWYDRAKKTIGLMTGKANFKTVKHESLHAWTDGLKQAHKDVLTEIFGPEGSLEWYEGSARAFEKYNDTGELADSRLGQIFESIKAAIKSVIDTVKGTPLEEAIDPEVRRVFDEMLGRDKPKAATNFTPDVSGIQGMRVPNPRGTGVPSSIPFMQDMKPRMKPGEFTPAEDANYANAYNPGGAKDAESQMPRRVDDIDDEGDFFDYEADEMRDERDAEKLALESGIRIYSNRNLRTVTRDKQGEAVGALWTHMDQDSYTFDVVVDPKHQRAGHATELVKEAIRDYEDMLDVYPDMKLEAYVVSEEMKSLLEKKFGWKVVDDLGGKWNMEPGDGLIPDAGFDRNALGDADSGYATGNTDAPIDAYLASDQNRPRIPFKVNSEAKRGGFTPAEDPNYSANPVDSAVSSYIDETKAKQDAVPRQQRVVSLTNDLIENIKKRKEGLRKKSSDYRRLDILQKEVEKSAREGTVHPMVDDLMAEYDQKMGLSQPQRATPTTPVVETGGTQASIDEAKAQLRETATKEYFGRKAAGEDPLMGDDLMIGSADLHLPQKLGENTAGHGIRKGDINSQLEQLHNLIENGKKSGKELYYGHLSREGYGVKGVEKAYTDGAFIAVLNDARDGVDLVLVNPAVKHLIPDLQKAHPNMKFVEYGDAEAALRARKATAPKATKPAAETTPKPPVETPQVKPRQERIDDLLNEMQSALKDKTPEGRAKYDKLQAELRKTIDEADDAAPEANPVASTPKPEPTKTTSTDAPKKSPVMNDLEPKASAMNDLEPKAEPPRTTGLSNAANLTDFEQGLISSAPEGKGRSVKEIIETNKDRKDFDNVANRVAKGESLTADNAAALLIGKAEYTKQVRSAKDALEKAITDGAKQSDIDDLRESLDTAIENATKFAEKVQRGKSEWSDIGRTLATMLNYDTRKIETVLQEARLKKGAKLTQDEIDDLTAKVNDLLAEDVKNKAEIQRLMKAHADNAAQVAATRKIARTPEARAAKRKQALDEFLSASSGLNAYVNPKVIKEFAKYMYTLIEDGARSVDDIIAAAAKDGVKADVEDVYAAMRSKIKEPTLSDLQKEIAKTKRELMADAKAADPGFVEDARQKKIQGMEDQIAKLKKQAEDGTLPAPKKKQVDDQIKALEEERRKALKEAQDASPEYQASLLEKDKERLRAKLAGLEDRIKRKDYAEKTVIKQAMRTDDELDKLRQQVRVKDKIIQAAVEGAREKTGADKVGNFLNEIKLWNVAARVKDFGANTVKGADFAASSLIRRGVDIATAKILKEDVITKGTSIERTKRVLGKTKNLMKADAELIIKGADPDSVKKYGSFKGPGGKAAGLTDVPFKSFYYSWMSDAAADYKARQILGKGASPEKVATKREEILADLDEHLDIQLMAEEYALNQTLNNSNWASETVGFLKKKAGNTGAVFVDELIGRFSKVITNVAIDATDRTGLGIIRGGLKIRKAKKLGNTLSLSERAIINDMITKGATGLATVSLGYFLGDKVIGTIKGERGKYIDYGDIEGIGGPIAPFLLGATIKKSEAIEDPREAKGLRLATILRLPINTPLASNTKDLFNALTDSSSILAAEKFLARKLTNMVIPGTLRDVAERMDSKSGILTGAEVEREKVGKEINPKTGKEVQTQDFLRILKRDAQSKIPFWRQGLPVKKTDADKKKEAADKKREAKNKKILADRAELEAWRKGSPQ